MAHFHRIGGSLWVESVAHFAPEYSIANELKIKQEITTYYARYSWANICKGLGYSKDLIAEALGHSYGNAVTGIYLDNYGNHVIDEANAKVIAAIFD